MSAPKRERCAQCQRPLPQCYCHLITTLANRWPVWIYQHPQESRHALGTARIAALGLTHCTLLSSAQPATAECFASAAVIPALIYPSADALPLAALSSGPVQPLLFLDATWRKSRRLLLESPWLQSLPRYALPATQPSRYRIRREPQPNALATLEAIVQALAIVEGDGSRYAPLLGVMDHIIEEQIAHMGQQRYARNYGQETP